MVKKLKLKKINASKRINFNVTNFPKFSSFFFDITKIYPCKRQLDNFSELCPNEEEKDSLEEKIAILTFHVNKKKKNYKIINILPQFKENLQFMNLFDRSKTEYGIWIKRIIEEKRKENNKAITLSVIQKKYQSIYSTRISLVTISRILRNHLSLHFRRITIKNPKLNQKWYLFIHFLFLKAIMKGIQDCLDIIYVDETGCFLENKYYYDWIGNDNSFKKGAEKNLKEKINVIMVIGLKEVLHYKLVSSSVNSENFRSFIDEMATKLSDEQKKKSIICFR